jgi:uncharacterized protein YjbJ (UPF0337 family)
LDKNRVTGKFDQAVGKTKQKIGDAVGNDKLANEGVADQVKGSAKETWGNVKDAARTTTERHTDTAHDAARTDREAASDNITHAKNKINSKIEDFKDREHAKDRHTA